MTELRKQFEGLPEIEERILLNSMKFCEKGNLYYTEVGSYISAAWVTGAWYAFQEQQKKIDDIEGEYAETERHLKDRIENFEVRIKEKDYIIESDKMLIQKLKGF